MTRTDRIQIRYTLAFDAPFHFGTGISAGLIDRTVIRDDQGYLYVPASTFKGVLREHCEQLCRFYLPDLRIASPHEAGAALAELNGKRTPISRIFGSQLTPGQLRFYDAAQTEEEQRMYDGRGGSQSEKGKYKSIQTDIATQVRIDRLTGTAADQALYTSEFGVRNLLFKGSIDGWLACTPAEEMPTFSASTETAFSGTPTYSLLLLLAGLQLIERLGGNKSTGKGHCICTLQELVINKQPCSQEQWHFWLEHLDVLVHYRAERSA